MAEQARPNGQARLATASTALAPLLDPQPQSQNCRPNGQARLASEESALPEFTHSPSRLKECQNGIFKAS